MPRPKQTEEEREVMRERILDAAHGLLMEQGPDAISVRAIAERVGVSHMVLYTYFENHDALARALRRRGRACRMEQRAVQIQRAEAGEVLAVVREVLVHYATHAQEHPRMYKFMWVQVDSNVPDDNPHRPFSCHVEHLTHLVQMGITQGVFVERDATLAAATVFAILHGPLLLYHNGRLTDEALRDQMSAETLEIAMDYLMRDA